MKDRRLPDTIRRSIAEQVAEMTPREQSLPSTFALAQLTELADDLPEYMLSLHTVMKGGEVTISLRKTEQWHHQMHVAGEPTQFAISQEVAPETWHVCAVWSSTIPARVEAALSWIDRELNTSADVAVLVVPAFLTYAVLLGRPEDDSPADIGVVVASTPEDSNLRRAYRYSLPEFVAALRQETPSNPFPVTATNEPDFR